MPGRNLPFIGIPCCLRTINERVFHTVSERYPTAVIEATGCIPIIIPSIGHRVDGTALLDAVDGLLLTGSPSNVEPSHYGGPPSQEGTLHDPDRDATTLPLIREAVRRDMPVLAICRGIQELNVALGGTLHQRVHEVPGRLNHRSPRGPMPLDQRYGPAHAVKLTEGGYLARLANTDEIMVNSLHGQGIDHPGPDLFVEAIAPDGQIEAVSIPGARFVVGVQWHPEYKPLENPFSRALFTAFAQACHATLAGDAANRQAA
ncbi:MAG TPA: gamma-glutamyl-gamma-aminobutyrate hydrolase family protein [Stellaceae bacterium]|jgi:putative glutamine amidotransferase|nr:gamma-glutamyl-gamma-aminobutyrate hydrolase family protein [Stellaceae bacterium]